MTAEQFRTSGYHLIDRIAFLLDTIQERPVTTTRTADQLHRKLMNNSAPLQLMNT